MSCLEQDNRYVLIFTLDSSMSKWISGSGIFVTPVKVLNGTGSIGVALVFWALGGFIAMCGLLVWLELGLSIPFRMVQVLPGVFERKSVARSGGEKNYVSLKRAISWDLPNIEGSLNLSSANRNFL